MYDRCIKIFFQFQQKKIKILYICMIDVLKGFFNIKKKNKNILKNKFKKNLHIYDGCLNFFNF